MEVRDLVLPLRSVALKDLVLEPVMVSASLNATAGLRVKASAAFIRVVLDGNRAPVRSSMDVAMGLVATSRKVPLQRDAVIQDQ